MRSAVVASIAISAIALSSQAGSSAAAGVDLRGLHPNVQRKLASATSFVCDSGSKSLPIDRLNDNYCDCDDGSDEAWHGGVLAYVCALPLCERRNTFATVTIPTSRVNDQICGYVLAVTAR
ncbi:hypothetical protein PINS_up023705 [Pythium insidiosum]|nr:hypothetical protein PINS_up023705 [Pythium insidiosum]